MSISFKDLLDTSTFLSTDSNEEVQAYLHKPTGAIYWYAPLHDFDPLPVDLDPANPSDDYLMLPNRRELGLGNQIVFDFVAKHLPHDVETVSAMFRQRGAYRRFKDVLERNHLLEQWHGFEEQAQAEALKAWCLAEGLELREEGN
jgi:hypothetical protein